MDKSKRPRIAVVGGDSLAGREVRDLIHAIQPAPAVELFSGDAGNPKLTRDEEGEATVLQPMSAANLAGVAAVILAGTPESSRRALELTTGSSTPLIDLFAVLEEQPDARVRSPLLEPPETPRCAKIDVIAHPAATMLAQFYARIGVKWPIQRSVVVVLEPASERGQQGIHELQSQTVNLLSFKPLPKNVYDAQLGFNLLPALGTEAPAALEPVEARMDRHLATLLNVSSRAPMPSLRLVQAPVFHGYSASVWVEFETNPTAEELRMALACAQIEVRGPDEEPPDNAGAAGQSGLTVGDIRQDRNQPRAFWFWLVSDNIRTQAETAVAVLREYL